MKNLLAFIIINVLINVSCSKNFDEKQVNLAANKNFTVIELVKNIAAPNGVLKFKSQTDFELHIKMISEGSNVDHFLPNDFYSLNDLFLDYETKNIFASNNIIYKKIISSLNNINHSNSTQPYLFNNDIEEGSLSDFIYSNYKNLVPDEQLSGFLNEDLQIIVGNYLYQITPVGTFEVSLDNIDSYTRWFDNNCFDIWTNPTFTLTGESLISEGIYQVEKGIVRQEISFGHIIETHINQIPPVILNPNLGINSSGPDIPMHHVVANKNGEGRGIVGLPNRKRFNFRSYNNKYFIWNSVGIEGKVQRLRRFLWMSYWGQSFGDQIIVGIDNLDLETDYFFPTPQTMSAMQMTFPKFKGFKKIKLGNYVGDFMEFSLGNFGLNQLFRLPQGTISNFTNGVLNSPLSTNLVNNIMKDVVPALIDKYVDPSYKDRFKNEPVYITSFKNVQNRSKLRFTAAQTYKHVFNTDDNNWRFDWNIMISINGDLPYSYKLKSGNFIGKARVGNNWVGVRIVKFKSP